jgi:ribonuclease HI
MVSCRGRCHNNNNSSIRGQVQIPTHLSFALETDKCTNNIAEYKAIILGLCKLRALSIRTCIVKTDSKVVLDR